VETTTGPLGQGIANAVGMALAERLLAAEFNRPDCAIVDHHTYVFLGDGCLMEGISHEACSLAGTLKLGKLIALYDDNGISIDGKVQGWFTDDTPRRFEAYGWHVVAAVDGHDVDAVDRAIAAAKAVTDRPSLICCKTVIGRGSPNKAGSHDAHGAALGEKEVAATRAAIGWNYPPFEVPQNVYEGWDARPRGAALEREWNARFGAYANAHPELAREFKRRMAGELPAGWTAYCDALLARIEAKAETIATRKASQNAIEGLAPALPEFVGGSADLTGSNLTNWSGAKSVGAAGGGNYVAYGVREFGMSAITNGIALHGGLLPFSGTFLTFSDYARNALRMAALMRLRNIFVYTHDSIGLGEDGPTHQSVEHVSSLRLMPNLDVWRPCDTIESAQAWISAVGRGLTSPSGPSALVFSRQNLQFQKRDAQQVADIARGAYVLADCAGAPQALLLATGSEVQLALGAQAKLAEAGVRVRVVSMPSTSVFDRQDAAYRESVLPRGVVRVAVEAGVSDYWRKYVGLEGAVIGIDRYGESAPGPELFKYFGFTVDKVVAAVKSVI
jgi:transketolase